MKKKKPEDPLKTLREIEARREWPLKWLVIIIFVVGVAALGYAYFLAVIHSHK